MTSAHSRTHQTENSLVQFNFEELRYFFFYCQHFYILYIRYSRNTFEFPSNISYLYLFLICRANVMLTLTKFTLCRFYFSWILIWICVWQINMQFYLFGRSCSIVSILFISCLVVDKFFFRFFFLELLLSDQSKPFIWIKTSFKTVGIEVVMKCLWHCKHIWSFK